MTTAPLHIDEARRAVIKALVELVTTKPSVERVALIEDLFGALRIVVWLAGDRVGLLDDIVAVMSSAAGRYFIKPLWVCEPSTSLADRLLYDDVWSEASPVEDERGDPQTALADRLRVDDRRRTRSGWFITPPEPPWPVHDADEPRIVAFMSQKGGVGRTTALAAFAIQRARQGESVVVVDFDLDAPGIGTLLAADDAGTIAAWGVVDYLLERPHGEVPLDDYMHRCSRPHVTGDGGIVVFPAGNLDHTYLQKLARLDLEKGPSAHPFELLLRQIRADLRPRPRWILIDVRAGLSPNSGLILDGLAHLYVLFATTSEQSFAGLTQFVRRLGAARVWQGREQLECLVVQALAPRSPELSAIARDVFDERAREIFTEHYLVGDSFDDPDDRFWSLADIDVAEAPNNAVSVRYDEAISFFRQIDDVADTLVELPEYAALGARILGKFPTHKATNDEG